MAGPRTTVEAQAFYRMYHSYADIPNPWDRLRWCRYGLDLLQKEVAAMVGMVEWLYQDLESGAFHRSFTPELADKLAALYDKYDGFGNLRSLQVTGIATMVEWNIRTEHEGMFTEMGIKIKALIARKKAGDDSVTWVEPKVLKKLAAQAEAEASAKAEGEGNV